MKLKNFETHYGFEGTPPDIIERNLNSVVRDKNESQKQLKFFTKYNDPEMIAQYKRRIKLSSESERKLKKDLDKANKEWESRNYLCPEGYIWVEKHYTKKGRVDGHCRKRRDR